MIKVKNKNKLKIKRNRYRIKLKAWLDFLAAFYPHAHPELLRLKELLNENR